MTTLEEDIAIIVGEDDDEDCISGMVRVRNTDDIHTRYTALHSTRRNIMFVVDSEWTGKRHLRLWLECVRSMDTSILVVDTPDGLELRHADNARQTVTFACDDIQPTWYSPYPRIVVFINPTQRIYEKYMSFIALACGTGLFVCDRIWLQAESSAALLQIFETTESYIRRIKSIQNEEAQPFRTN